MEIENKKVWLIMTKCRKFVAKGTPKNRYIVSIDDKKDKKRYLTYTSKGMAESAFRCSGFYTFGLKDFPYNNFHSDRMNLLEAVECEMIINII